MDWIYQKIIIKNKDGLHARPSTLIALTARKFESTIILIKDNIEANAKSIFEILLLGAEKDSQLTIKVKGSDAQAALSTISVLLIKENIQ